MLSEIGSNFWITPDDTKEGGSIGSPLKLGCNGSDYVWMSTGRSATALVLDTIEERNPSLTKIALIPSFTCHTVIKPFLERGYQLYTYHVDIHLTSSYQDILSATKKSKAGIVLIHRYFGFNTIQDINSITSELKNMGTVLIEDCTQTMYSLFPKTDADYFVGSIRKWCGVPDGGFAVCREGVFNNKPSTFDTKLQYLKKIASLEKYDFLLKGKGEKQIFLNHFREAENILDSQDRYYAISDLSAIIQSNLDSHQMSESRRRNFLIISNGLMGIGNIEVVFAELKKGEVPLYCPILCRNRFDIQQLLVKNAIYAPVVWPKADYCPEVDKDADHLYNHLLCIPIDQRYGIDDMERVINILRKRK